MATKQIITDDLGDDGEATTIEFGYKGVNYLIDLNAENAKDFDLEMERYVKNGRIRASRSANRRPAQESQAIREWAAANGHEVAPKGRIPQAVLTAYTAARLAADPAPVAAEAPAKTGRKKGA